MYHGFLTSLLTQSAQIANRSFGKVSVLIKPGDKNQVLTKTDLEISPFIIDNLNKLYPTYNVIDEEAGIINKNSDYTWVIDPIDGTSNFANGVPMYGVMIGLLCQDKPVAGGVVLPFFKELYIAEKGSGCMCNGNLIIMQRVEKLSETLVAYGIDGFKENLKLAQQEAVLIGELAVSALNIRSSNSCFDAIQVARGKYGGWLTQTSSVWDNVALQIIIEEAGGKYTSLIGEELDYEEALTNHPKNYTVCAGAVLIHSQLQELIKKLMKQ